MILSLFCTIQCALAPILLSLASVVPSWAHFGHGWFWVSIIFIIALFSIGRGYLKHKHSKAIIYAATGLGLMAIGTILEHKIDTIAESLIFVLGGLFLVLAHWKNYQFIKQR